MKNKCLISIIMPCYNCDNYVSKAIESILTQTFSHFELIIINDGSIDKSDLEIKTYTDSRIKYISLKKNIGNYSARNIGMQIAKGKYVGVMDADDIAHKERLMVQYNFLEKYSTVGCVGTSGEWINEKGDTIGLLTKPAVSYSQLATFLLIDNYTLHPSLFFRRSLLEKNNLRYNEHYKYSSDFDFVSRCAQRFPVINISESLLKYRTHPEQISMSKKEEQKKFADQIRLSQVERFNLSFSRKQSMLYLKLLDKTVDLTNNEQREGFLLLNNLLQKNINLKIYNHSHLYSLFDYILNERS